VLSFNDERKKMKPYRIIIADDHSLVRLGLKSIILTDSSLQVIAEAGNGIELLDLVQQDPPDMVILDITMPHLNGIEAVGKIRQSFPLIAILVLTMHTSSQYFYQAIAAGAHGYLMKDDSDVELLTAIKTVQSGKSYISPQLSSEVTEEILMALRDRSKVSFIVLSEREKQVLKLVVQGNTSKKIASMLGLSARTIDHHRANLLRKFKKKNTVDLVHHVIQNAAVLPEK
jgi:two-component system response regulator NreC